MSLARLRVTSRPLVATHGFRPLILNGYQPLLSRSFTSQVQEKPKTGISKFIQQSKELVTFYKDGLKLLWTNKKEAAALQLKVKEQGYLLNRPEFQLVHRSKKDMLKLIPFGLVFLILPESIPLWVIYVPSMIPSTCIKETQLLKQRAKLEKIRQRMNMNTLKSAEQIDGVKPSDFLSLVKFQKIAKGYGYDFDLSRIDRRHLSSYCEFMGLNDWGTQGLLEKRLDKYMKYISQDDMLLKDHGVDKLTLSELSQAIEERGMRSIDVEEEQMKKALKYWVDLNTNSEQSIPPGLMVFSRMFLLNAKY